MDPRHVPLAPGAPVAPGAATVFVDPRPPLHVEKEKVHDFEVHREGGYAKGHVIANKEVSAAHTDSVAIGAQPHVVPVGAAVDPRPPLKVEKERVHDFEAHREGGYAKKGTATTHPSSGLVNVPGGPAGHRLPGDTSSMQH